MHNTEDRNNNKNCSVFDMAGLFPFQAPVTIKDRRRKTPATYEIVISMNEKNL